MSDTCVGIGGPARWLPARENQGIRAMKGKELLRVSVLGNLAVLHHHTRMPLPPSKKTRALLAYLAVTARPHSRDRLCAMFWPVPGDRRAALRWSLTRLRPLVDEPDCRKIIADRENVGLDLDRITVDILSLRSAARSGTDAMSIDALRQATEALEGEFLEGLDLPDCQEFQSWCTGEREETRRLRARLLAALVARLEDMPDEALRYARTLSLLEPGNEAAQAVLVRLLRAAGCWREAEEQFQRAQRRLSVQRGRHRRSAEGGATAPASRRADARGRSNRLPARCGAAACAPRLARGAVLQDFGWCPDRVCLRRRRPPFGVEIG